MRPQGIVRLFTRGRLVWECESLFVNSGLPLLANLIAGVTTGQYIAAIGFDSKAITPTATDTSLATTPTYYNAIGAHSFPSSGSVLFNYSLLTTDYGADDMITQELGLFANSSAVSLPVAAGTRIPRGVQPRPKWQAT
jgi:hypothetical protein